MNDAMLTRRVSLLVILLPILARGAAVLFPSSLPTSLLARPQAMNFDVEGKINRLERDKFTLSTEENMIFHVRYDDKTEFKRPDGNPGSAKDLRVGLSVRVVGDLSESGELLAHRIEIQETVKK